MKKIEKTKLYYNGISNGYSKLYHNEQKEKIESIKKELPKNKRVLDLGSGDGVLNEYLKNCDLYSLDISEKLLELNPNSKEKKILAPANKTPFANEYFDSICSFTMLQDAENKEEIIEETYRILKKSGKLIISFLKTTKDKEEIIIKIEEKFQIEKIKEINVDIIIIAKK